MADTGIRLKDPVHPGGFIRREIIPPELNVTEAAQALEVSRTALSQLLNEHADLSPDMALRLEKAFGAPMETLMHLQHSYDIAKARREDQITVKRYVPRPEKQPDQPNLF